MKMRVLKSATIVAAVAFLAIGGFGTAKAALFDVTFAGEVMFADAELAPTFDDTQTLSGSYRFESSTAPNAGSDSDFAVFDALVNFDFTIGGYSASSMAAAEIQVDDAPNAPNDRYGVVSRASEGLTGADVNDLHLDFFSFRLDDSSNAVFNDALILPTMLDLTDFDNAAFFVFFGDYINFTSVVVGTITSLSITPVVAPIPLPAALPLFAGGLGAMGLLGWRRKRTGSVLAQA